MHDFVVKPSEKQIQRVGAWGELCLDDFLHSFFEIFKYAAVEIIQQIAVIPHD